MERRVHSRWQGFLVRKDNLIRFERDISKEALSIPLKVVWKFA